jgi:hypothetical protein
LRHRRRGRRKGRGDWGGDVAREIVEELVVEGTAPAAFVVIKWLDHLEKAYDVL